MGLSNTTVAENSALGTVVGLFTARDWNFYDKRFTYTVSGADASFFRVKGDELQIAQSPDYETKKRLKITAKVTDEGGASFSKDFHIIVTDIDDTPPVISSLVTASTEENTLTFAHKATANEGAIFSLHKVKDNALFQVEIVNEKEAFVRFKTPPDFEKAKDADKNNVYELELTAVDAAGNIGKKAFSITVTDVNEQAVISQPESLSFDEIALYKKATLSFNIANTGNAPLKITGITYPDGFSGDWSGGAILAGESQLVNVTFSPTEVKDYSGIITVDCNTSLGRNTLDITGKGVVITALEPQSIFPGLNVFPNPAADVLNVKLPNQIRPLDIQLVDVNGQVAYERKAVTSDKLSIDVSGYRSGVYLVLLTSGSKVAKWRVAIK